MKTTELLTTQLNADQQDNSDSSAKPIWERAQIVNSPLWIVGNQEKGYHITMGKYKITKDPIEKGSQATLEQMAEDWLYLHIWDVILTIALCASQDLINQSKQNQNG